MDELFPRLLIPDDAPAVTVGAVTLSYRELAAAARRYVAEHAIRPGQRIPVMAQRSLETVIAFVGNALAHAVSVPIDPKAGERERAHILTDARAPIELPEDTLLVLYTSGTTGPPKGVVLSRRAVAQNLDVLAANWQWSARDTLVHALPIFHVHGLVLGLFGTLRVGAHLVWLERFSPEGIAAALEQGATMLFAVPTMYHRLVDQRAALRRARLLVSGSAALPAREHEQLGVPIYERYGSTETLITCAAPIIEPPRPGWVGPALPGVELRLVDEDGRDIDPSEIGELVVRSPSMFSGYLHQPVEGWFHTGDLATMSPDGWVRILGRKSTDLIKTGGFRVGAGEIEACLLEAEGVSEAAVVGVPDDDLGERIVAYVVGTARPDDLIAWVAGRLTPHKRPRRIEVVSELPRNALGKVQKHLLR